MIHITITIQGEPDTSSFTIVYHYPNKLDEEIFINSKIMIQDRLDKNLKINLPESILLYSAFIVSRLRDGMPIGQIQKNVSHLLSPKQVMIGVPETLRKISFEILLDDQCMKSIVLNTPIPISDYILRST